MDFIIFIIIVADAKILSLHIHLDYLFIFIALSAASFDCEHFIVSLFSYIWSGIIIIPDTV